MKTPQQVLSISKKDLRVANEPYRVAEFSPLETLPRGIRDRIWKLVLSPSAVITVDASTKGRTSSNQYNLPVEQEKRTSKISWLITPGIPTQTMTVPSLPNAST
jgi:hypothetical protein